MCNCDFLAPYSTFSALYLGSLSHFGVATGIFDSYVFFSASFAVAYGFLILGFAPCSSIFRLFLYTHVRTRFSWSHRCLCSIVSQGGAAGRYSLGNPRARRSNFSSVNVILLQNCCVVMCCCVRTYGTRCLIFGDTFF